MKVLSIGVCGAALTIVSAVSFLVGPHAAHENTPASRGLGNAQALRASYERWKAGYETTDGRRTLVLPLTYSKGLSSRFTTARGQARLDLTDGMVSVEVAGLLPEEPFAVWLVDNVEGKGRSVKPERGDVLLRLGALKHHEGRATVEIRLDRALLVGFEIDLVVVTRASETPIDGGILFGSASLFERIYYSEKAGRLATLRQSDGASALTASELLSAPFRSLIPRPAYAQQTDLTAALESLVAHGEKLFFEETFSGNGRTCGTCHPADNNFTIDPAFIATLPPSNPLFVAEFRKDLKQNFENPVLMRQFGLILENVDGFDDLANKFVMRGVPHTLALTTSLNAPAGFGPAQATGWGGDGAPGGGSLRDFATGAVTQHFTKTLARVPGVDFRLPTDAELDAMAAFQLSLGRESELNLSTLVLHPAGGPNNPTLGKELFNTTAKCNRCHANAGANTGGANRNFNTGVEDAPHPAETTGEPRPRDGGFGTAPNSGAFGNGTFNTTTVVEAADTPPFFHNNVAATIEDAVAFYTTPAFSNSPAASNPVFGTGPIVLTPQEIADVAAFLRTLNALENIRSSLDFTARAQGVTRPAGAARKLLSLAIADVQDAINVLQGAGLYASAVQDLESARYLLFQARSARDAATRNARIDAARAKEMSAKAAIVGAE